MTATTCPTCGGLGKDMRGGQLVRCEDCEGEGRVPAVEAYPFAAYVDEDWKGQPTLLPIPKEGRSDG